MRSSPLVAIGAVAYAAFLVATLPARFVASQVERHSGGAVHVHDVHGSAWHGAARVEIASGPVPIAIDSLAWRLAPAEWLSARIGFQVDAHAAGASARGVVARGLTHWHARGEASAPASALASLVPLAGTWRPEGRIEARSEGLAWNDRDVGGEAAVEWRDASVALSDVRPLGGYRVAVRGEGASARVALSTLRGPLRLSGEGSLVPPSRFSFNGEARAEGPDARALDPILDLLGPRRADGARTLAWRMN